MYNLNRIKIMHNASALLNLELNFSNFLVQCFSSFFQAEDNFFLYNSVLYIFKWSEIAFFSFVRPKLKLFKKPAIWRLLMHQICNILVTNCNWTANIQQNWSNLDSQNTTKLIKVVHWIRNPDYDSMWSHLSSTRISLSSEPNQSRVEVKWCFDPDPRSALDPDPRSQLLLFCHFHSHCVQRQVWIWMDVLRRLLLPFVHLYKEFRWCTGVLWVQGGSLSKHFQLRRKPGYFK